MTIGKTLSCKCAGIEGYKTIYSLRATSTTRLYESGVDEKLVMERMGHRSLEGVRCYKLTSDSQRQALSNILNWPSTMSAASTSATLHHVIAPHLVQSAHNHQLLQRLSLRLPRLTTALLPSTWGLQRQILKT